MSEFLTDQVLTLEESAEFLRVSKRTLVKFCREKGLAYTEFSPRIIRLLKSRIIEFMKENEVKPEITSTCKSGTKTGNTEADRIAAELMNDYRKAQRS